MISNNNQDSWGGGGVGRQNNEAETKYVDHRQRGLEKITKQNILINKKEKKKKKKRKKPNYKEQKQKLFSR